MEYGRHIEAQRLRLEALYEVSAFLAQASSIEELARGFAQRVRTLRKADAAAVRSNVLSCRRELRVRMLVRADRVCSSVAAASVLAKCERDGLMQRLAADFPVYGWGANKGYGSAEHVAALRAHGLSPLHRCSWRLPVDG